MEKYINPFLILFINQIAEHPNYTFDFDYFTYFDSNLELTNFLETLLKEDLLSELTIIVEKNDIWWDITKDWILDTVKIEKKDHIPMKVTNKYIWCISKEYYATFQFKIEANLKNIKSYIKKYNNLYIDDKISNFQWNYLLPSKQVSLFAKILSEHINNFWWSNISFDNKKYMHEGQELDILSLILYFYTSKLINIKKYAFTKKNININFSINETQWKKIEVIKNDSNIKIPKKTKWDDIILQMWLSNKKGWLEIYIKDKYYGTISFEKMWFYNSKQESTTMFELFKGLREWNIYLSSKVIKEKKQISDFSKKLKENIFIEDARPFRITEKYFYVPKFQIRLYKTALYDVYDNQNKIISFNDNIRYK